jgi:tetratricopeptide (TPR) repeat protein
MHLKHLSSLATTFKHLSSFLPHNTGREDEARLYYRRACLAAAEERYDVALIFCRKAVELDPTHLPTRLLIAQIHDYGRHDLDAAVAAYRKIIVLAAYDHENPYCASAQAALDTLLAAALA